MYLQKKIRLPGCVKRRPLAFICLAAALCLFLAGQIRPQADAGQRKQDIYGQWDGRQITLTGRVYKKETAGRTNEPVSVIYLKLSGKAEAGDADTERERETGPPGERVVCYLAAGQEEPELGSTVKLSGKVRAFERATNPGQFDAFSYYQISGISYRLSQAEISAKTVKYNRFMEALHTFRGFLSAELSKALPQTEASVMQTMLLGEKRGMEKELKALYQRNGIAHVLAISGLHISLLGMGIYRLFRRGKIPMKAAAGLSFVLMFLYGAMTGFSVSAVRAVFMFSIQMLGIILERTYDMVTAAALAAAVILIKQPLYLRHSGFWFSFGCVLGIGLLLPALTERGRGKSIPALVKGFLGGVGMAAVTFPLYLKFYYQFPVYSVFLNFLVIPLMSLLMAAGLFLLVCQILFPPAAAPFSCFIKGVLLVYEKACGVSESLPGHLFTPGEPEDWQLAVYFLVLVFVIIARKNTKLAARWGMILAGAVILIIRPPGGLLLTFLDVGQGDCIYIENEDKSRYLVDGGSSSVSGVGEYRILPFLKSQGASLLDAVFVTHPDEDHCNGIRELLAEGEKQGIRIDTLILPDIAVSARGESYLALVDAAGESGIPVAYISRGQRIERGELSLICLHPGEGEASGEPNEYSIVMRLVYKGFSALLTGDVEGAGELQLTRLLQENDKFQEVTVLKAAHHGSRNSTGADFLGAARPGLAVISAGKNNKYGHPHAEMIERLKGAGCVIYETSKDGAVMVRADKSKVRVKGFTN
ncbi:DNA internalization-related competence protein ComEC/Rec2 [bacterium 1xD8-48]|nr:DNA internalization-related competence protein ComEC/Rec2 [Lachnospiraceae bacterium]NBJ99891.1 DNA internalization-related competence protein ComEC/Rec2 [bacterium 1xD8-48]